jgi:hypothetical protein
VATADGGPLGAPRVNGETRLNAFYIVRKGVEWINLAKYRDEGRAFVNTVMNLRDKENAGKFFE